MTAVGRDVLAVVIGRAGSRGLPGKNARLLAGRPMICHTIDDALGSECVQRVVVSTDGEEIAAAAEHMGIPVVPRPAALASDTATVDAAVRHAVEMIDERPELVVILYANVPVRPDDLVDRAVRRLLEAEADSVQSYSAVEKHHPFWMVRLDEVGHVSAFMENTTYRRQDLPPLYLPDGGVIVVTPRSLFRVEKGQPHAFLGRRRFGIISPPGSVVDIDTEADLRVAEAMLAQARGKGVRR